MKITATSPSGMIQKTRAKITDKINAVSTCVRSTKLVKYLTSLEQQIVEVLGETAKSVLSDGIDTLNTISQNSGLSESVDDDRSSSPQQDSLIENDSFHVEIQTARLVQIKLVKYLFYVIFRPVWPFK